ncbi:hypothetical protein PsYK624_098960 [Phanerochaete sordida]|uniref:F-box domain-containing protein n=1 Tax=Phanerochaete sordida TaxID=48140 RepID=A0A9P3GHE7_9APHY|nr:hypothetical protein PsYK624_098960 [Phanerochaete sordida]
MSSDVASSPPAITNRGHTLAYSAIPQELLDRIIDFLHDERDALAACSLVHRRWLPASSLHLFSLFRWPPCKTHWYGGSDWHRYACWCRQLLDSSKTLEGIELLFRNSPRISDNVRDLRIVMWTARRTTTPREIAHIFDALPRLQSLDIGNLDFSQGVSLASDQSTPRFLRRLRLGHISSNVDLQNIYDLLSCFETISTLSFQSSDLKATASEPPNVPAVRTKVNTLELLLTHPASGGGWIGGVCAHIDVSSLTTLAVQNPSNTRLNTDALSATLHGLLTRCTALRTLVCHFGVYRGLATYPHPCPTLREVHFVHALQYSSAYVGDAPWLSIRDMLGRPLGATVRDVLFDLELTNITEDEEPEPDVCALEQGFKRVLERMDWAPLAAAVGGLRSVTFDVKLKLLQAVEERDPSRGSTKMYMVSRAWKGQPEVYRVILEGVAGERLAIAARPRLLYRVTFVPIS